jgi:hypothetical protein
VLFAHGFAVRGRALSIMDDRLRDVFNFVGLREQRINGNEDMPSARTSFCPPTPQCSPSRDSLGYWRVGSLIAVSAW